jgi:hypothetical protein
MKAPGMKAKVAELVDAHDSKSCILGCAGSIPAFGTLKSPVLSEPWLFLFIFGDNVKRDLSVGKHLP